LPHIEDNIYHACEACDLVIGQRRRPAPLPLTGERQTEQTVHVMGAGARLDLFAKEIYVHFTRVFIC